MNFDKIPNFQTLRIILESDIVVQEDYKWQKDWAKLKLQTKNGENIQKYQMEKLMVKNVEIKKKAIEMKDVPTPTLLAEWWRKNFNFI